MIPACEALSVLERLTGVFGTQPRKPGSLYLRGLRSINGYKDAGLQSCLGPISKVLAILAACYTLAN